jgi:alkanesulfonate monooxygenase SsuD/methylene tetrahydromethanopterin reductase-like flavin-dependent oxidoreductase (luciferase family)
MDLSGVGVWSSQLRYGSPAEVAAAAAELEELGFTALWIPDVGGPVMDAVAHLLASTKQAVVATGILNLWMHEPSDVAAKYATLSSARRPLSPRHRREPRPARRFERAGPLP